MCAIDNTCMTTNIKSTRAYVRFMTSVTLNIRSQPNRIKGVFAEYDKFLLKLNVEYNQSDEFSPHSLRISVRGAILRHRRRKRRPRTFTPLSHTHMYVRSPKIIIFFFRYAHGAARGGL